MQSLDSKPIPIRLKPEIIQRIDAAAEIMGTNRAALIRFCADTFAKDVIRRGKAALPPNWSEIIESMDGRTAIGKAFSDVTLNDEVTSDTLPATKQIDYRQTLANTRKKRAKRKQAD